MLNFLLIEPYWNVNELEIELELKKDWSYVKISDT